MYLIVMLIELPASIIEILYKPGKFINASFDKASEDNERNYYKIKNNNTKILWLYKLLVLLQKDCM